MAAYKHVLFDLDHTLWDFDANCAETIAELYLLFGLEHYSRFTLHEFTDLYKKINQALWNDYHRGLIDKNTLRTNRFEKTFEMIGINNKILALELNDAFMRICPTKKNLLPFTHDILGYLKENYCLHILTNGFRESQHLKMKSSGIAGYFLNVFNSETTGFLKPDKKIFDFTVSTLKARHDECIMIGDDLKADILGAKNAGIDHVFYNRSGEIHHEEITFEIKCLSELKAIL